MIANRRARSQSLGGRRRLGIALATTAFLTAFLAVASVASAAVLHSQLGSFADPPGFVTSAALTPADEIYLANLSQRKVFRLDESGTQTLAIDGSTTPAAEFSFGFGSGVAVDNSASANEGDFYVADTNHGVVDRFGSSGAYLCQITGLATPSATECNGGAGSETPTGSLSPAGLAVDSSGDLYVANDAESAIDVFAPSGEYLRQIADSHLSANMGSIALDASGGLVVTNLFTNVVSFDSTGSFSTVVSSQFTFGVAVAPNGASVYAGQRNEEGEGELNEYGSAGNLKATIHEAAYLGIAVEPATGDVWAANVNQGRVEIFSPGRVVPDLTTAPPSQVEETQATLNGEAAPDTVDGGGEVTSCQFEYLSEYAHNHVQKVTPTGGNFFLRFPRSEETAPGSSSSSAAEIQQALEGLAAIGAGNVSVSGPAGGPWTVEFTGFLASATVPMLESFGSGAQVESAWDGAVGAACQPPAPISSATPVTGTAGGLEPSTSYYFRLIAADAEGTASSEERAFNTRGPAAISAVSALGETDEAAIRGKVNPFGYATSCEVEYVTEEAFQASGYSQASSIPCAPPEFGPEFTPQPFTAHPTDLQMATTYRYRVIATNQGRTTKGEDLTFKTFGVESFTFAPVDEEGNPYTQAGGHPYDLNVDFKLNAGIDVHENEVAGANARDIVTELPVGFIGNPQATPTCTGALFTHRECPAETQVGFAEVITQGGHKYEVPVLNLEPPHGVAAQFGFRIAGIATAIIDGFVRSGQDYGVTAYVHNASADETVTAVNLTMWGVPASPSHESQRYCPEHNGSSFSPPCGSTAAEKPFLRNPTSCTGPQTATIRMDTWQRPGRFVEAKSQVPAITGCARPPFAPTVGVRPTTSVSDSPSGLHVELQLPQPENLGGLGLASADLRNTTVTLPRGFTVNPAGADGLAACSLSQIDLHGSGPAQCPDQSKIGTVEIETPLLDHPLTGAVYVARQRENPFDSLLAIYIAVYDPSSGVVLKLAGHVEPDPTTGQLTTTFSENPQLPFSDFKLDFFGGPRAALRTPPVCGSFSVPAVLTPWSAPEGETVNTHSSFAISSAPSGPCPSAESAAPNAPTFEAGTESPIAGSYAPMLLKLSRPDGSQQLASFDTTLPPGLTARLSGVPYCPEAAIAAAAARSGEGEGAAEQARPSCPAASQIGIVNVGAGAGSQPLYVQGRAYLAGPYKGAPISVVAITPAIAGPFDLGTVVVRSALYVNPETAQVTVKSDPLPTDLHGIQVDLRSIAVRIDRPQFSLNPTSCEPMAIGGTAFSVFGQPAALSQRFQVGGCATLPFKPRLKIALKGSTRHAGHPGLRAVLTYPKGGPYANVARAQVNLPHSEFIDQGNLNKTCTKPVLLEGRCPAKSIYGKAKAWTPLLDKPLQGPVYLVGGFGYKLPALVAELNGQIRVLLVGKVDSGKNHGIRNTFEAVPDAPVEKFELRMKGGKKYSLLENSENLCARPQKASARFTAQSGKVLTLHPKVINECRRHKKHGRHGKHHPANGKPGHRHVRAGAPSGALARGW